MSKSLSQSRSGFTLTELAIVLGVIGAIIGGVWMAATAVHQKNATTRAARDIGYIVNHIQAMTAVNPTSLYIAQDGGCVGGQSIIQGSTLTSLAAATSGIVPEEMISGAEATPTISSPWAQGDVKVVINAQSNSCTLNSGGATPGSPGYVPSAVTYSGTFTLVFAAVPVSACEQILLSKGIGFANMGLISACTGTSNYTSPACSQTMTITPATAMTQLSESAVNTACTLNGGVTSSSTPISLQLTFTITTPS